MRMDAEPERVRAALAVLQMDHSMPKRAICTKWKRCVQARRAAHTDAAPDFRDAVDIDYVNHLLFSVVADPVYGPPMVRPRCLVGSGQQWNCHKGELEHCMAIGLHDFAQVRLRVGDEGGGNGEGKGGGKRKGKGKGEGEGEGKGTGEAPRGSARQGGGGAQCKARSGGSGDGGDDVQLLLVRRGSGGGPRKRRRLCCRASEVKADVEVAGVVDLVDLS